MNSENNAPKKFLLRNEQIKSLAEGLGSCIASDRILIDGCKVGYMYREVPDNGIDSGWRFLAGDEDENYMGNADNLGIYDVNTIANYDPEILPYLGSVMGSAFARHNNEPFQPVR